MISKATKKQLHYENFNNFLSYVEKMHKVETFNFENLRRNLRPFFKTQTLNNQLYYLKLKHSKQSICFKLESKTTIKVLSVSNFPDLDYSILNSSSNKEFLQKILKHNFFTYAD